MYWLMLDSRSDDDYGQPDSETVKPSWVWSDIFSCPVILFLVLFVLPLIPIFAMIVYLLCEIYSSIRTTIKNAKSPKLFVVFIGILFAVLLAFGCFPSDLNTPVPPPQPPTSSSTTTPTPSPAPTSTPAPPPVPIPTITSQALTILVDDFRPQPYQGEAAYFFNRLEGDRGAINDSILDWGTGQVRTTISSGNSWGGVWMSLNHPIREGLPINFSAISPPQMLPAYQSQITGITVQIARGTPNRIFKLELKDGNELRWKKEIPLEGGQQVVSSDLPALGNINHLVWVLDHASAGDYVVVESISFTAVTRITDTATVAFAWSYGMLLNNWSPTTGLVRDKAKDASGEFDAIQATGSLAAATAVAEQLGIVSHADAVQIVSRISDTLLLDLPRYHGLWPHWVKVSPAGEITIVENTEWSSVDTVIAAIGLLAAQSGLGMDTSGTEQMLQAIDWDELVTPGGISHGYTYTGDLIPYAWDVFGGESWLVELAYAGVTGQVAPIAYPSPPTANGSGFIDELAWLFVPPPSGQDHWGTDWRAYRLGAADDQISYYPSHNPQSCFAHLGLFGLSAAEVPDPSSVPQASIYQAFGVGGQFSPPNDGLILSGAPVVVPHYSAMIASLRPVKAIEMWDRLIDDGYFSPLTNVESLMYPARSGCDSAEMVWNQLKGSWNLSLQTLGWGRYLAERDDQIPILWQATKANPLLSQGYLLLVPDGKSSTPISIPTRNTAPTLSSTATLWAVSRECEYPDEGAVGQMIWRSNASGLQVHGQFGTTADPPWPAKSGYVTYNSIHIPQLDHLYLRLRYSKYSPPSVPILIYVDDELTPRSTIYPMDQGDWNQFVWTDPIHLGNIGSGVHSIRFSTDGQQYGVADLDEFVLAAGPAITEVTAGVPVTKTKDPTQ